MTYNLLMPEAPTIDTPERPEANRKAMNELADALARLRQALFL
jgi:hypothetical protein